MVDLIELLRYLQTRDCLIEKFELEDVFLNDDLKLTINFNLFLNSLSQKPVVRTLPFRNEFRDRNNCPDLFFSNVLSHNTISGVNSWNVGLILYQLLFCKKPFHSSNEDLISKSKSCSCAFDLEKILKKEYQLTIAYEKKPELAMLIAELLKPVTVERLKFDFIVIHPFLKTFPTPPHVLYV